MRPAQPIPTTELGAPDLMRLRPGDVIRPDGGSWMIMIDPPRRDGVYGAVVWLFCESLDSGERKMWQACAPIRADVARADW